MSVLQVTAQAHRRLVLVLVTAIATTLAALGFSPVPAARAADPVLSFVAASSSAGNRTAHSITLPAGIQAGDTMVLFMTVNSISGTLGAPAGWTLLETKDGTATRGRAWTRQATASDAGATVSVTSSALVKDAMAVSVYRSAGGTSAVTASASTAGTTSATSHTTPSVDVAQAGSWLVSSWSEKSTTDPQTWTAPAESTSRATPAATGSGKVSSLLADSNAPVPTGTAAGRTATTSAPGGGTQLFSVVISPGTATANRAPAPSFTTTCTGLTCAFNASATTDPDNNPLTYAWDYGDGSTGTGVTSSRTYASAGTRTVTLTVSDGTTTAQTTRTATTSTTPAGPRLPVPGHTRLVPETARTDLPRISNGEIFDIRVVNNRVFIAGSFTSIQNRRTNNTTTYTRSGLASYNLTTGLVDTGFNPRFTGGVVDAIAFTPDNTKLFVTGSFGAVNGVARRGLASLNITTGAPVAGFVASLSARGSELVATNSTLYVGGRFTAVNNVSRSSLAAVNAATGAVDTGFVNNLSGGIGTNGALGVQELLLTHDQSRLIVVHTARQVAGQDRYGVAMIGVASKQLLPWKTKLWEDNLQFVGGIQRAYAADVSPDDSYFVVTSGSGGDRPPINDTAMAFPVEGGDDVKARWITRCFDSIYSVAVTERAVYLGGHFGWNESPSSPDPWPGLDDVGYGTGQGLSGYGLGDAVVNREHLGALNPVDGRALEWNPGSNSFEGNKAMIATPRGLFTGGDATTQAGSSVGRIAFFDFNSVAASNGVETTLTDPIEGRVLPVAQEFTVRGTASVASGTINRVELRVYDREANRYLADNRTTWQTASNTINTTLQSTGARTANWSLPLTVTGNRKLQLRAQTFSSAGTGDNTPAMKKAETFGLTDQPPNTDVTGPSSTLVKTMTYTVTGTATDDVGVQSIGMTIRDENNRYLQADGTVQSGGYTFRITPDVVGAKSTTWSREITVPVEGTWKAQARATDSSGQADLDTGDRTWIVSEDGQTPTVSISAPTVMLPPTPVNPYVVAPGSPLTFRGSAEDDENLNYVEVSLRNNTTRENLSAGGTWGTDVVQDWYRISPAGDLNTSSYNWSYTTPFNLTPGSYSFQVRAVDDLGLNTPSAYRGSLTINAQVPGDAPPDGLLNVTGTVTGGQSLNLNLAGTATDDKGVSAVRVSLFDGDTSKYVQPNGTLGAAFATRAATLASPNATSTNWTLAVALPQGGDYNVTAYAVDTANQQDISTTGATARYRIYPGDAAPTITDALLAPTENTVFDDGRIFVSGRAEDDQAMQRAELAIVDSAGRYMSSSGTFTSTSESWRSAFLTSPGTPGSNFSYTSPVVPPGAYTIRVRGMDNHDQVTAVPSVRQVSVTHPPGNTAPVAKFINTCPAPGQAATATNVCEFDGRTSTDENAATLSYAWTYTLGASTSTSSGPKPIRTFTAPGAYTVQLIVTDEWGIASAPVTRTLTITEPTNNVAPTPVLNPPSCSGLVCNFSGVGSADSNLGDTFTYLWDFADGTATSTSSAMSHTFPSAGTYVVRLTTTDGWGKASTVTRSVTVTSP